MRPLRSTPVIYVDIAATPICQQHARPMTIVRVASSISTTGYGKGHGSHASPAKWPAVMIADACGVVTWHAIFLNEDTNVVPQCPPKTEFAWLAISLAVLPLSVVFGTIQRRSLEATCLPASIYLGLDFGTEGVRAGLFDPYGHCLGKGSAAYDTRFPNPGEAEQAPEDWWTKAPEAVRMALKQAGVSGQAINALGVDATSCSVVLSRQDGMPLYPSLLWMDVRAGDVVDDIAATDDPALAYHRGQAPSPEWMVSKVLWLRRHKPACLEEADVVAEAVDWITFQLTGRWSASRANTRMRWHFGQEGAPRSLYETLGLDDVLPKFPTDVLALGSLQGWLQRSAAEHLGLRSGIPVAQGGADAYVAALGLGMHASGDIGIVTGSSHVHMGLVAAPQSSPCPGLFGPFPEPILDDLPLLEGGLISSGSVLRWFVQRILGRSSESYRELDRAAAGIDVGSQGLITLEWWQGNRTPHADASIRGLISGLSLYHDYRHVYRSILEAVACGSADIVERMVRCGVREGTVSMCGGVVRSPLWLAIHADVMQRPIAVPEEIDSPLLGAALLAAVAAGRFSGLADAVRSMVRIGRVIEPRPEARSEYADLLARYQAAYPHIKAWQGDHDESL